ncbi:MAG: RluA family pseudouridine synthase [Phycisphaerales bacterium]|jgi:tRNA pseudouridine32 synthase/23S rRNA pseudouridine746 synthase|nr:RluA family pseudouridine synthase [Phycisphaerales bacterium]
MNNDGHHPNAPPGLPGVLHKDEWLVVFSKPVPMLSVPGIGPEKADCLASRAAKAFPGARIVHRLDRDTSGVIVMAFDADTHRSLSIQFQDRLVEKHYEAIVFGEPPEDEGLIDAAMRKDLENPPRQCIDSIQGKSSQTAWQIIERLGDRTRLKLTPRTGRSHQLRLHLQHIGHPILGDDLYAPPEVAAMSGRLCLHATELTFTHPATACRVSYHNATPF